MTHSMVGQSIMDFMLLQPQTIFSKRGWFVHLTFHGTKCTQKALFRINFWVHNDTSMEYQNAIQTCRPITQYVGLQFCLWLFNDTCRAHPITVVYSQKKRRTSQNLYWSSWLVHWYKASCNLIWNIRWLVNENMAKHWHTVNSIVCNNINDDYVQQFISHRPYFKRF